MMIREVKCFWVVEKVHSTIFSCCFHATLYISFCLAQSGQMMSSPSVINPLPTNDALHDPQLKQLLCQWLKQIIT